jgi:hypothetical protein
MQRLRSAHAFLQSDRRTVVVSEASRIIVAEALGARVLASTARFRMAQEKPILAGVLAVLGGEAK